MKFNSNYKNNKALNMIKHYNVEHTLDNKLLHMISRDL